MNLQRSSRGSAALRTCDLVQIAVGGEKALKQVQTSGGKWLRRRRALTPVSQTYFTTDQSVIRSFRSSATGSVGRGEEGPLGQRSFFSFFYSQALESPSPRPTFSSLFYAQRGRKRKKEGDRRNKNVKSREGQGSSRGTD